MSSTRAQSSSSSVTGILHSTRHAFFGVLHLSAKKNNVPQWLVYILLVVKVVQLLAFVVDKVRLDNVCFSRPFLH